MRRIVLRIDDLNLVHELYGKLMHVSFYVREGDVLGILGMNNSGKDLLVRLLAGKLDIDMYGTNIWIGEQRIRSVHELSGAVCLLDMSEKMIENWSVAEYLSLSDVGVLLSGKQVSRMYDLAEEVLRQIGYRLDVRKNIRALNELERRMLQLLGAVKKHPEMIIVEDDFSGMSKQDLEAYKVILDNVASLGIAVMLSSHMIKVETALCSSFIVLRRGRLVKKSVGQNLDFAHHLEEYLIGETMYKKLQVIKEYEREDTDNATLIYSVNHIRCGGSICDYQFHKHEVTTFVVPGAAERKKLFGIFSGRAADAQAVYYIDGIRPDKLTLEEFLKNKVASLRIKKGDYELQEKMSVGDNLLLPSLRKISHRAYFESSSAMLKVASSDIAHGGLDAGKTVGELVANDKIRVSLERWYLFNPKVFVLYEPFSDCDIYGASVIQSYIKKFANLGTAVIVIKSNAEYMEELSDRMVMI